MVKNWTVPQDWRGETAVCLGGGPSLSADQVARVPGRVRVIAVNDAWRLAPWAEVLYACDGRWWDWHGGAPAFAGLKVTQDEDAARRFGLRRLVATGRDGFDPDPAHIRTGGNGGYQALHLAVHFGARRIVLLGYDMQFRDGRSHWHGGHPRPTPAHVFERVMVPAFETLAPILRTLGIEVLNVTPGSALTVFPRVDIEDAL